MSLCPSTRCHPWGLCLAAPAPFILRKEIPSADRGEGGRRREGGLGPWPPMGVRALRRGGCLEQGQRQVVCQLGLCRSRGDLCDLTEPVSPCGSEMVLVDQAPPKSHQRPSERRAPLPTSSLRARGLSLDAAHPWVPEARLFRSELPSALPAAFLLKVLVVWDETSNKVRNYRIFEKVSGLAEGPEREGVWLGAGQSPQRAGMGNIRRPAGRIRPCQTG